LARNIRGHDRDDVRVVEEYVCGATGMWSGSSTGNEALYRWNAGDVPSAGRCTRCAPLRTGEGSGLHGRWLSAR